MHFINQRWLGGMLTNYKTIRKRIDRLHELARMEEDGTFDVLPKKEVIQLRHEAERLEKFLGGIKNMDRIPDVLFVVDPRKERIAVFFFSSRRRHTRWTGDWSSDVCSSD